VDNDSTAYVGTRSVAGSGREWTITSVFVGRVSET
jgi:hypothetical protein